MNAPSSALGRVTGALAEQLAYLNSPAAIQGEIGRLEAAIKAGDTTTETRTLLADWRAVQQAQRRIVGGQGDDGGAVQAGLDMEGATR